MKITDVKVRKINAEGRMKAVVSVTFDDLSDESSEGYDLFTDVAKIEREKKLERTVLNIKDKYGKNAMLRGMDLEEGATTIDRNLQIGGHKA